MWTNQYKNIATASTVVVAAGPAQLQAVEVNTGAAAAVVTVYDNASAGSGTKIATIDASASKNLDYQGLRCKNGITVVMAGGNADITVVFA